MRHPTAMAAVVIASVVVTGCSHITGTAKPVSTVNLIPRPLVERELPDLLLPPDQVNAAMGSNAMSVVQDQATMSDNTGTLAPVECTPLDDAAEATVYANSGSWAEHEQSLNDGDKLAHYLKQAVILFPTQDKGREFFDASAQQWATCTQFTHLQSQTQWSVGPISNSDGVLSTTVTELNAAAPGRACGRAMQLKNNVIIDINTCSADPGDSAVKVANQIATNVAARW